MMIINKCGWSKRIKRVILICLRDSPRGEERWFEPFAYFCSIKCRYTIRMIAHVLYGKTTSVLRPANVWCSNLLKVRIIVVVRFTFLLRLAELLLGLLFGLVLFAAVVLLAAPLCCTTFRFGTKFSLGGSRFLWLHR